jgi:hypothetical protein
MRVVYVMSLTVALVSEALHSEDSHVHYRAFLSCCISL